MTQILETALRQLEARHKDLREEMSTVEQGIAGIRAVLARDTSCPVYSPQDAVTPQSTVDSQSRRYEGLSVRWGVLQFLAGEANGPASTADIAAALLRGGMTTRGRDFISNVSAVISVMVNKREELEAVPGSNTYRLTTRGQEAWHAIQQTNQYQARSLTPRISA